MVLLLIECRLPRVTHETGQHKGAVWCDCKVRSFQCHRSARTCLGMDLSIAKPVYGSRLGSFPQTRLVERLDKPVEACVG